MSLTFMRDVINKYDMYKSSLIGVKKTLRLSFVLMILYA